MLRYPDGTFKVDGPATLAFEGYVRPFGDLTREQRDAAGYNEALPLEREPFTTYETQWEKGEDLVYREAVISAVVAETERLEAARRAKQQEITEQADAFLARFEEEYGPMEQQTWEQQYAEARAVQADPDAVSPLLDAIAVNRGMDMTTLATHVLANREAWIIRTGTVIGQRLAYQDRLDGAQTVDDMAGIDVCYVESI
ncbi:hypothetical protein GO013_02230 [Pseudodesulfovibrio sp. JC047]|uniref:hypothetical protein n=1 Tax=Pseudodesulfovibrio sp. JC047 TaxID=2683199 RepID=UPI0013D555D0|nr:hypothetical protein [Pseudodesulfovibrio sp. JC047]NDV18236.1 hypothetical protein [Pseudodesulfovibrio sp. JC047]